MQRCTLNINSYTDKHKLRKLCQCETTNTILYMYTHTQIYVYVYVYDTVYYIFQYMVLYLQELSHETDLLATMPTKD